MEMTGALNEQSAVRVLDVDDVRLTYVVDGAMAFRPAAFFPSVPADHWGPDEVDESGRVVMSAGGLLVERAGRLLLIDAGLGPVVGENPLGSADCGALPETLAALGHRPEDVEVLAFTHLHADHTGWAFADGAPVFPKARYLVAAREVVGESPFTGRHTPIGDGDEVFPGVRALVTPGHSPGHTSYVITTATARVVAFGDAFHAPAQLARPDWGSGPDWDGALVPGARARLVEELEKPGTLGFATHFGDQVFGQVVRDAGGTPRWRPVPARALLPAPRGL